MKIVTLPLPVVTLTAPLYGPAASPARFTVTVRPALPPAARFPLAGETVTWLLFDAAVKVVAADLFVRVVEPESLVPIATKELLALTGGVFGVGIAICFATPTVADAAGAVVVVAAGFTVVAVAAGSVGATVAGGTMTAAVGAVVGAAVVTTVGAVVEITVATPIPRAVAMMVGARVPIGRVGIDVTRGAGVSIGDCVMRGEEVTITAGISAGSEAIGDPDGVPLITTPVTTDCGTGVGDSGGRSGEIMAGIAVGVAARAVTVSTRFREMAVLVNRASGTTETTTLGVAEAPTVAVTRAVAWLASRERKITSAPMMTTSAPPTAPSIARGCGPRGGGRCGGTNATDCDSTTRWRTGISSICVPSTAPEPLGGALYPVF